MEKVIKVYGCDICKEQKDKVTKINYPVIFHTEQTEGKSVNSYISQKNIDVCDDCLEKIARIDGYGAQGHNEYIIK